MISGKIIFMTAANSDGAYTVGARPTIEQVEQSEISHSKYLLLIYLYMLSTHRQNQLTDRT